ncbi:reverse transcriptase family protein [Saccharothrix syringae]|uniref:hypothetical protein n=1 Tax=Saccharothrix syringae TaxID=103733 RepID=UPI001B80BFEE|nr:hypothetical protein [Saccharothrix syringae]
MNTDDLDSALLGAERRVLRIQTRLHCRARDDCRRRFDDLFNLVADPAFLLVAWDRLRGNKGARTAGVDRRTVRSIEAEQRVEDFLDTLRSQIKDRGFRPMPVGERMIPKTGGRLRRLGIATITDRVVQACLKLVLEPIFEADFLPLVAGLGGKTTVQPGKGNHHALPLPGSSDPDTVADRELRTTRGFRTGLVERPVPGSGHAGCGKRSGETNRSTRPEPRPGSTSPPTAPTTCSPSSTAHGG